MVEPKSGQSVPVSIAAESTYNGNRYRLLPVPGLRFPLQYLGQPDLPVRGILERITKPH